MTEPSTPRDLTRVTLSVIAIAGLIAGTGWVMMPFLGPLLWAGMIVIATWPILVGVQARLGGRRAAAVAVMTVALLLGLVVPLYVGIATVVQHSEQLAALAGALRSPHLPPPPGWVESLPIAGERVAEAWRKLAKDPESLSAWLAPYLGGAVRWFASKAGSVGTTFIDFLLTVLIAAILYSRGEGAAAGIQRFFRRLAGESGESAVKLAARAVRAVALGVIVTAIAQTAMSGAGLAVVGIPAATLLSAVVFMLCIAQIGPLPVMIPAVGWLFWTGSTFWASALLLWTILISAVDNVLRPLLIRRGADLPLLLIFAGVIGGLIGFGIIGLFVGPVVLAVTYTLVGAWSAGHPLTGAMTPHVGGSGGGPPSSASTPEVPRRAG